MWQILKERLDLTIGRTAIVTQFQNARPITGESIGVYVVRLQAFQLQLQGSTEEITDQALRTHDYTTAPPEFKTAIGYLKRTTGITIGTGESNGRYRIGPSFLIVSYCCPCSS